MDHNSELEATKTNKGINDLDVIGIESILQFLPADDLSAFSHTCSQFKDLTEQYFYRNGSCGLIKIKSDGGKVGFDFNVYYTAQFVIRFRSFIRFLCVEMNSDLLTETFQFIKDNCAEHLIYLNLWNTLVQLDANKVADLSQTDGTIIAEQLKHVKVLELGRLASKSDIYDNFLKYCEQLQILVMLPSRIRPINTTWMNQQYYRLEALIYLSNDVQHYCDEVMQNFSNFLRNHPNLKAIVTDEISLIKSLCISENDLPYAAMAFEKEDCLLNIWKQFVLCCKQKFIKSIELIVYENLSDETLRGIFQFDQIKSIHWFVTNVKNNTSLKDLPAQPHIEKLCISFIATLEKELLHRIVNCFPCLRELRIYMNRHTADSYKSVLMPIIGQIGTLEDVYMQSIVKIPFYENDIIELHTERLNQKHTTAVSLHLCTDLVEFNAIIPENSLVSIKMYRDYEATACPFNNFEFKKVANSLTFLPKIDVSL